MTNDISDTDSSELNQQPAESIAVAEPSAQMLTSHTQDDISNLPQPEENSQIETSSPRAHGNNEEPSYDLHTVRNFIHKLITLLQEFLTSLDKKGDTSTNQRITEQKPIKQPKHSNSKKTSNQNLLHELHKAIEIIAKQHQFQSHDKTSINNHPRSTEALPQQLHNLQKLIGKIYRFQTSQRSQQNFHHKPETRLCHRCGIHGHVAKFCRSRPLPKTKLQVKQTTHLSTQQRFIRQQHHQQLRNIGHNPTEYDPINNWQSSPRCSRKISSPDTTKPDL